MQPATPLTPLPSSEQDNDFTRLVRPALDAYAESTGLGCPTIDDAVVSDLITDLHHWCDKQGWCFMELCNRALAHYLEETCQQT